MKKLTLSILALLTFLLSIGTSYADGYSLKPGVQEYELSPGEIKLGEILFKSNEKTETTISATVETYDPKTEEILNKQPFVALNTEEFSVKAGQEVSIDYVLSIPKDTPVGSYFNIITITEKRKNGDENENSVGVKKAVGAIIAMHVIESEKSIEALFFDQSTTSLKVTSIGLPLLSPTQFEYTYTNNSNFVFRPEGEIRVLDQAGKQVAERFEINPEKKAIYPGESYSEKLTLSKWDPKEAFNSKDIIARTYSGYGNEYITDKVTLSLKNSIIVLGVLAGLIVLTLLVVGIKALLDRLKRSKQS